MRRCVLIDTAPFADSASYDATLEVASDEPLVSPLLPGFALPIEGLFRL